MNWVPWILSGVSILLAFVGLLRTFRKDKQEAYDHLSTEIALHQERLGLIEMKIGVFWRLVEENLSGMLKRPTHLEMDALLDKLKAHTLTKVECYTLKRWLHQVYLADEVAHQGNRLIATLVMGAVESLIAEFEKKPPC